MRPIPPERRLATTSASPLPATLPLHRRVLLRLLIVTLLLGVGLGSWVLGRPGAVARASHPGNVIFVNDDAPGEELDGSSWQRAFPELQFALAHARSGDEIWVAKGTYRPTLTRDRTISFQLKDGVAIYGGFAATETLRSQRDWIANVTILSGDIGTKGQRTDNSFHVVAGSGTAGSAILDGVTVRDGEAVGTTGATGSGGGLYNLQGSPALSNLIFRDNRALFGAGIYNDRSSPTLTNVTFSGNEAGDSGGGIGNNRSSPTLTSVTFSDNQARNGAGILNVDSSSPTLVDVTFSGNAASSSGGGMFNSQGSSPTLTNVTFSSNRARQAGGGMYNVGSNPTLRNVVFSGNSATFEGGGMVNDGSSPVVTNVTFSGNSAFQGGAMFNVDSSHPTVHNSILWGNSSTQIVNSNVPVIVEYSLVQGGHPGEGNVNADPRFVDADGADNQAGTADDNLQLRASSPAIDAGNNFLVPLDNLDLDGDGSRAEPVPFDLNGNPRFVDHPRPDTGVGGVPVVDMGAYEASPIIFANGSAFGAGNGSSWAKAYTDLQAALDHAEGGNEVWVAAGNYKPTEHLSRTISFRLESGEALYGGFAGDETTREQRNVLANRTILSGDIGRPGDNADNSFHVVVANGTEAPAILDGFTVTGGNANGASPNDRGGGLSIVGGSATVTNATLRENAAVVGGAIFNRGTLALDRVTLAGNTAGRDGGALSNAPAAVVTATRMKVSGNRASRNGGGLFNGGRATVSASTLAANSSGYGGGLFNAGGPGSALSLTNSTVSGNQAILSGGGLFNRGAITLSSATVAFNTAQSITQGNGGGLHNDGGIVRARNTILAANLDPHSRAASRRPDCSGALVSGDYNLIQNMQGCTITGEVAHNKTGVDPLLGALQNNGGPTPTHALPSGSPAVNAGNPAGCSDENGTRLATDQRGQPRHQGAACDIGAFERARRRSVGISELAPSSGGSDVGVLTTFTLTWTHPVAWRQLETLDLRFTGSQGALFAVRFTEEVTSTFSLLDEEGEVVGTAPAGSDVVLQTEGGALGVARSGFSASGPEDPSVVVTFAVSFTQAAEGHTYTMELLASGDGGQIEGPDPAGTWRVGPPPPPISLPLLRR